MKLVKFVSNSGLASRRNSKERIIRGEITVNGELATDPAMLVGDGDCITLGDRVLHVQSPRLWLYHKPVGLVTTHSDPHGRETVFDNINLGRHVLSVGRLDLNTSGLLLITNVGWVARHFELPENGYERAYIVRAYGTCDLNGLHMAAKNGVIIDGIQYAPFVIKTLSEDKKNTRFYMKLREGKNREIRRIFCHFKMQVNRLMRVQYGPYFLNDLRVGAVKEVYLPEEFEVLV